MSHQPPCGERGHCRVPQSFNYTARGERVQPSAGVYWIPATAFSQVVAAARANPAILNCYRFVAVATSPRRAT